MQKHAGTCWGKGLCTSETRMEGRAHRPSTRAPCHHHCIILARPNCIRIETGPGGWCSRTEFHYRHGVKPGADADIRLHAILIAVEMVTLT